MTWWFDHLMLSRYQSARLTLIIMAIAFAILIPIMLVYNGYQHLVFRGKTTESS